MKITVRYLAQIKHAAGVSIEQIEAAPDRTVREFVVDLAEQRAGPLRDALLNPDGNPRRSVLLFVGERQVAAGEDVSLRDGDELLILSPIAGG